MSPEEARALVEGVATLTARVEVVICGVEALSRQGAPLVHRVEEVEEAVRELRERQAATDQRVEALGRSVRRLRWWGGVVFLVGVVVGLHLGGG